MNFEEAVKEHKIGNDVYLESEPEWIWYANKSKLEIGIKRIDGIMYKSMDTSHTKATDWAVVKEKKVFNLSDECKDVGDYTIVIMYREEDIQQFIGEIKEMIGKEMSSPTAIQIEIDKLSGERFK